MNRHLQNAHINARAYPVVALHTHRAAISVFSLEQEELTLRLSGVSSGWTWQYWSIVLPMHLFGIQGPLGGDFKGGAVQCWSPLINQDALQLYFPYSHDDRAC